MTAIDWDTARTEVQARFGDRRTASRPAGLPANPNPMTPDLLGYFAAGGGVAEVTTGVFLDHRLYGITWPRLAGRPDPRDCCCHTLDEVAHVLALGTLPEPEPEPEPEPG